MTSLMGAAYTLKLPSLNRSSFRTMIGLRKYICSQFKPNVAKVLYDKLDSKSILDFSAGWGDRLAGFYGSETGEFYIGIDQEKKIILSIINRQSFMINIERCLKFLKKVCL